MRLPDLLANDRLLPTHRGLLLPLMSSYVFIPTAFLPPFSESHWKMFSSRASEEGRHKDRITAMRTVESKPTRHGERKPVLQMLPSGTVIVRELRVAC